MIISNDERTIDRLRKNGETILCVHETYKDYIVVEEIKGNKKVMRAYEIQNNGEVSWNGGPVFEEKNEWRIIKKLLNE